MYLTGRIEPRVRPRPSMCGPPAHRGLAPREGVRQARGQLAPRPGERRGHPAVL